MLQCNMTGVIMGRTATNAVGSGEGSDDTPMKGTDMIRNLMNGMAGAYARRRRWREGLAEIAKLTPRDLADIGYDAGLMREALHREVYGTKEA